MPSIKQLLQEPSYVEQLCVVRGWVRSRRDSKAGFSFLAVNDGSCLDNLQLVAASDLENYQQSVLALSAGCSIEAEGKLVPSQGQGQAVELQVSKITLVGNVENPDSYPIAKKRHSLEYLRTVAHLRPRTNLIGAVTRMRTEVSHAIHDFFYQQGFQWINTPIITASDCEGAGEMFRVSTLDLMNLPRTEEGEIDFDQDFFASESFLTVSGQLNVEAYCLAMSKVYTFGPTFRAENSHTSRHLAEFWMVEPEIAFADLEDDIALAEQFLRHVVNRVLQRCEADLAFFDQYVSKGLLVRLQQLSENSFERMSYSEAVQILQNADKSFEFPVQWGVDLQSEHERFLCEEYVGRPLVVTDYPKDFKAFYMRLNEDDKTVAAMDVLAPGIGEIIGGSQREERVDVLQQRMAEQNMSGLDWYVDLRRYGGVPHAGFGLGFERLLSYLTGVENIRDVIPFPRVPRNAAF